MRDPTNPLNNAIERTLGTLDWKIVQRVQSICDAFAGRISNFRLAQVLIVIGAMLKLAELGILGFTGIRNVLWDMLILAGVSGYLLWKCHGLEKSRRVLKGRFVNPWSQFSPYGFWRLAFLVATVVITAQLLLGHGLNRLSILILSLTCVTLTLGMYSIAARPRPPPD